MYNAAGRYRRCRQCRSRSCVDLFAHSTSTVFRCATVHRERDDDLSSRPYRRRLRPPFSPSVSQQADGTSSTDEKSRRFRHGVELCLHVPEGDGLGIRNSTSWDGRPHQHLIKTCAVVKPHDGCQSQLWNGAGGNHGAATPFQILERRRGVPLRRIGGHPAQIASRPGVAVHELECVSRASIRCLDRHPFRILVRECIERSRSGFNVKRIQHVRR
jgi:hypothetical protein